MDIETERLKAFVAVARERSFSRAAEKLFRTQPAVSQAVRLLEDEIGERLFVRRGRIVALTRAGRILLEHADAAFGTLAKAVAEIEALRELRTGEVTIAASDTTTCYFLPPILKVFRNAYPEVELRILNRPSPLAGEQVAAREADLGIVTLPLTNPRLASEALAVREDVAICGRDHPLARRRRISLADLAAYPLLLLDRGSNTRTFIDGQLRRGNMNPTVAMELGSIEVIKKLVQLGFGVSIVPRIAVEEEARRGHLHALRVFPKREWRSLGVVYPSTGTESRAGREFVRILKERGGKEQCG